MISGNSEMEKKTAMLKAIKDTKCDWFYFASSNNFTKIPGCPISYWVSDKVLSLFQSVPLLSEVATPRQGLATSDNNRFVRYWYEVSYNNIGFNCNNRDEASSVKKKWFPFNKGGGFRRWAGNHEYVVNWENDGAEIKESILRKYPYLKGNPDFVAKNPNYYFRKGLTWSALSSGLFSIRYQKSGFIFADKGQAMFPYEDDKLFQLESLLNSKVVAMFLKILSPTLDFNAGYIAKVPVKIIPVENTEKINDCFQIDWDSYETAWDFIKSPFKGIKKDLTTVHESYIELRHKWRNITKEMQAFEEDNNRIFIEAYDLQSELTPDARMATSKSPTCGRVKIPQRQNIKI